MSIERVPPTTSDAPVPPRRPGQEAARAAVSPSGLVLGGAGVALGVVAGVGVPAAIIIGAACWGLRVAIGAARAARRRSQARQPEPIDPFAVPEPWRRFVREAVGAQGRFAETVARSQRGPMRDRLQGVAQRVDDGVAECWRVARLGAGLDATLSGLDPDRVSRELVAIQKQRQEARLGHVAGTGRRAISIDAIDQTEAALATQLKAARRIQDTVQRATDKLRILTAQLNEAVAGAVELSLDAGNASAAGLLAGNVESVVGEIKALREAMEETDGPTMPGSAGRS